MGRTSTLFLCVLAVAAIGGCSRKDRTAWGAVDGIPTRDTDLAEWAGASSPYPPVALLLKPHSDGEHMWVYGAAPERGDWRTPLFAQTYAIDLSGNFVTLGTAPALIEIDPSEGLLLEPSFPEQRASAYNTATSQQLDRFKGFVVHYRGQSPDPRIRWQVESGASYPKVLDARQWAHALVGGASPFLSSGPDPRYFGPLQVRLIRENSDGSTSEAVYRVVKDDTTIHLSVAFDDQARWMYIRGPRHAFAVVPVEFP